MKSHKIALTMRIKLIILYMTTVTIPSVIIIFVLPYYYDGLFTKQTTMMSEGILTSLTTNVEMYLDDLERLTITPYLNDDVLEALKFKASNRYKERSEYSKYVSERSILFTLPKQLRNTRKDILGTVLLPADGSVYLINAVSLTALVPDYPFKEQEWYKKATQKNGSVAYISSHSQDYLSEGYSRQVFSVARLLKDPDSSKPLGVIKTDAANIILENIINDLKFNVTTIVAVLDENNKPLYSNKPIHEDMLGQLADGQDLIHSDNDTYRAINRIMPKSGWSIVILTSNQEFQSQLKWIYRIGILYAAGGIVLTMLLNVALSQWIVKPFREMVRVMKRVQKGDLDRRFLIKGNDEIAQLGSTLNTMISQLKELINREYKAVLGRRDAEYQALQSQIQPHFLYNTLNGLIGLNRSGQHQLLEKAILSLSSMLRYTMEHKDTSSLEEEFVFLRLYCELQHMRFGERLQYHIEFDPELAAIELPKLILQPLVENAIIHGIEPLIRPGKLVITANAFEEEDSKKTWLLIRIEDNGRGFEEHPSHAGSGVGLSNVRERLALFNKQTVISITSIVGEGTIAEVRIPLFGEDG